MPDLLAGTPVPLDAQIAAAEREIAMRRRVYPNWVAAKKMSQAKADAEIAAMEAIRDTLMKRDARKTAVDAGGRYRTDVMKVPGCPWQMWSGVIGISDKLAVFDADIPVGIASDLSAPAREALAARMVELWRRFGEGEVLVR